MPSSPSNIIRIISKTVRGITNEILEVRGMKSRHLGEDKLQCVNWLQKQVATTLQRKESQRKFVSGYKEFS